MSWIESIDTGVYENHVHPVKSIHFKSVFKVLDIKHL